MVTTGEILDKIPHDTVNLIHKITGGVALTGLHLSDAFEAHRRRYRELEDILKESVGRILPLSGMEVGLRECRNGVWVKTADPSRPSAVLDPRTQMLVSPLPPEYYVVCGLEKPILESDYDKSMVWLATPEEQGFRQHIAPLALLQTAAIRDIEVARQSVGTDAVIALS